MTEPERRALRALVVAATERTELDPAVQWIQRQLDIDARRRTPRGPYYGSHGYWRVVKSED